MPKRQKLDYNREELTQSLKQSAGQGVDALFSQPSTTPGTDAEAAETEIAQKPQRVKEQEPIQAEVAYERTVDTDVRTDVLLQQVPPAPDKRRPERYAFQFWEDQVTRLKKLNQVLNLAKNPEDREEVTLSNMVREAIDDYLNKQVEQLREGTRTNEQET